MENRNRIHWNNWLREIILNEGIIGLKDEGITAKEARKLIESLRRLQSDLWKDIDGILILNPDYPYPDEYQGKEVEYWKDNKHIFNTSINNAEYFISVLSEYRSKLLNPENSTLPTQQSPKQKPKKVTPKTFEELFYNTDLVMPSIEILKELHPPFIDTDYNYIGRWKGVICVWIDELQRQGIVKHYSDRKIFASLIPQKIKRFSINESMFGKYQSKAENNYRLDIKTLVSRVKLSHDSQKGK